MTAAGATAQGWRERRVIVTGASSGVGRATAIELAARGATVNGWSRRTPDLVGVAMRSVDVTDESAVAAAAAAAGEVDTLVLAHGDGTFRPLAETTAADVRAMLEAHVLGTLHCLRAVRFSPNARVVVISSVAVGTAFAECSGYTAAKAGQAGLARAAAVELAPAGVRVTLVTLGATDTPIWDDRPGFDRRQMLAAAEVAGCLADLLTRREIFVEAVTLLPAAGRL